MTSESPNFWTRLTAKLKPRPLREIRDEDLPEVGEDGLLAESVAPPTDNESEPVAEKPSGPLARWSRRDQAVAQLQEGYERVTQVIEDIQKHLSSQGERSERICTALEQLARSQNNTPAALRQQIETLENIASQLQTTNSHTERLAEALDEIPKASRMQSQTMEGINHQLEVANEHSLTGSQTLDKLSSVIAALGQSNNTQTRTLSELKTDANHQNELLSQLIAKQSKRFTMLFVVTLILAAAAIVAAVVGMVIGN